jgi:hypothetical protein
MTVRRATNVVTTFMSIWFGDMEMARNVTYILYSNNINWML